MSIKPKFLLTVSAIFFLEVIIIQATSIVPPSWSRAFIIVAILFPVLAVLGGAFYTYGWKPNKAAKKERYELSERYLLRVIQLAEGMKKKLDNPFVQALVGLLEDRARVGLEEMIQSRNPKIPLKLMMEPLTLKDLYNLLLALEVRWDGEKAYGAALAGVKPDEAPPNLDGVVIRPLGKAGPGSRVEIQHPAQSPEGKEERAGRTTDPELDDIPVGQVRSPEKTRRIVPPTPVALLEDAPTPPLPSQAGRNSGPDSVKTSQNGEIVSGEIGEKRH